MTLRWINYTESLPQNEMRGKKNKEVPSPTNINCAKQSPIHVRKNHKGLSSASYSITWPLQTLEDLTRNVSFTVSPLLPATASWK